MKYLILALAAFTTTGYAQDLEKVKDLNNKTKSGAASITIKGPLETPNFHLNGVMYPDDASGVCNIELEPRDYVHDTAYAGPAIIHQYTYSSKENTCKVQLTIHEKKAELTGEVVLTGDCSGFCGMSGDPSVFNGQYKLAK